MEAVPRKFKYRCMTYPASKDLHFLLMLLLHPTFFFEIPALEMPSKVRIKIILKNFSYYSILTKVSNFTINI